MPLVTFKFFSVTPCIFGRAGWGKMSMVKTVQQSLVWHLLKVIPEP